MSFGGYREDKRGQWFGGGTEMIYCSKYGSKETKFYVVNEKDKHLIRIRDEKQIELLQHCFYGPQVDPDAIPWLISSTGGRFKYYDSVQEFIDKTKRTPSL